MVEEASGRRVLKRFLSAVEPPAPKPRGAVGQCSVCFRAGRTRSGRKGLVIAVHGYKRTTYHMIQGRCPGSGYPPWELSSEGTKAFLPEVEEDLQGLEKQFALLKSGEATEVWARGFGGGQVLVQRPAADLPPESREWKAWDRDVTMALRGMPDAIRLATARVEGYRKLIAHWEPKPLGSAMEIPEFLR